MSFEKYGNKLINLLSKIEHKLNPNAQIGGGDGPETNANETDGTYVKILSYSVNHVSVLVHLEKDGNNASELENAQISYTNSDKTQVNEYSIEQQLRLGCDNKGQMYKYSIVLQRHPKKEETDTSEEIATDANTNVTETSNTGAALGKLSGAFENLSNAVQSQNSLQSSQ